jgi:TIR domain
MPDPYAIQYSDSGKTSRKDLPPEALAVLFDLLDTLADNPDAFPGRVRPISRDGNVRLYKHPSPPLEVTFEVDAARRVLYLLHFVAPKVSVTKPVFISYSHKDAEWLAKLKQFLGPLEEQNLIRVWDDTEIQPGAEWLAEIRNALGSARVAVFLVTQDFLNSPFVKNQELPALMEAATNKGCLIFWIAVKASTFADSPLAKFQGAISPNKPLASMSDGEQAELLLEVYQKMKAAVSVQ